jgi:diguanylate cyclase
MHIATPIINAMSNEVLLLTLPAFAMIAVGAGLLAWWLWEDGRSRGDAATMHLRATTLQLNNEATAILKLVRDYLEAGDRYSVLLAQADKELPSLATPEEVGIIVRFLIAENAKMQQEAGDLEKRLEQSKSQIEKLRSNLAEAQEMGMRDPLTSLRNRRSFDINLAKEVADARAKGTTMSLVMGDIDHFKSVNDVFGHLVGDEILRVFASVLAENVRSSDTVARYGGEEFAIILPMTELGGATQLTERMRSQFEAKELVISNSGQQIGTMTASFGIAQLGEDDDAETLIRRADAKLYEAKCAGRNRVAVDGVIAA